MSNSMASNFILFYDNVIRLLVKWKLHGLNRRKQHSDGLFMSMITLINPRKAEDPPTAAEIKDYIEYLEPI